MNLTDKVEAYLRARPLMWIPAREFEDVGGRQAWRTRLSDCRRYRNMTIENRVRHIVRDDGSRYAWSEYRFLPASLLPYDGESCGNSLVIHAQVGENNDSGRKSV